MNDVRDSEIKGRKARNPLSYAIWGLGLIGVAAVLYVISGAVITPGGSTPVKDLLRGEMKKLDLSAAGAAEPATPFIDERGKSIHLADLKARLVVVNLWATWCGPCVKEMPTLARLQAAYPGYILVAPISMDKAADREKARAFIAEHPPLKFYQDSQSAMAFALSPAADGFPTTIIYDRTGREVGRLAGGADWNGPDARALFEALLAKT